MEGAGEYTGTEVEICALSQSLLLFMIRIPLFSLLLAGTLSLQAEPGRPNILFIYTDDQSTRTVSCYPDAYPWVDTPNIDALAESGVRFSHAYIGSWCMPSRATMLTGHHQHGIESMRMAGTYPGSVYDPDQCPFWPSVFREQGYTTAHIGKWHTGVDGGFGRDWDFQKIWNRPKFVENAPFYYYDQLIETNGGEPVMTKGYSTDNYTEWAVDYIRGEGRAEEKPWYLWLCYGAVHGPFTPADRHLDDYEDAEVPAPADVFPPRPGKPKYIQDMEFWEPGPNGEPVERQVRKTSPVGMKDMPGRTLKDWVRQYHQGVLAIDEGVGKVLEALKESGQDENTLVVFTSDQGFAWGQHGFKSKVAPYHATVAAPLIIRPPAERNQAPGRVVEQPVSGVDLPPTFFAQAGLELPWEMHGHDLSPWFSERGVKETKPAMLVHTAKLYGSETDTVPDADDPALLHGPGVPWYVMLADGPYKYIRTLIEGETEELYHLRDDPGELTNLAHLPEYRERLLRMREETVAELERTGAGFADDLPATQPVANAEVAWKKHTIQEPVQGGINSAVANDWDADGAIDVISSHSGSVTLYRGPDWEPVIVHRFLSGQSRNKPRAGCIHSCLMDVDGDGDQDFIGSNNTVFWLECPDDPFSGKPWTYRTVDDEILGTHCLITGDVDQDGKLDLIANSGRDERSTSFPHSLAWLAVPKDPHTAKSWIRHIFADRDAPGGSHYTGIGDLNGDGRPDIACGAKGGKGFDGGEWFAWWEQPEDPTSTWTKRLLSDKEPGASNILPTDLDGNGVMDLFATRGHGHGALWYRGPDFEQIEIDSTLAFPHSLALADLDGDGDVDAVSCGKEQDGIAAWYENDGKANFTRHIIGIDQGSYDTRAVDMDGDGDLDVLIAGHASRNVVWFENPNR